MSIADWGGIVGGAAGIIGGGVAVWQGVSARGARRDAQAASTEAAARASEATAALHRMATAQESIATASRPSAWGVPKSLGGDAWVVRNSSGRSVELLRVDASPPEAQPLLETRGTLPRQLAPGDLLEFAAGARLGFNIRIITLVWHFADESENEIHDSQRTLR